MGLVNAIALQNKNSFCNSEQFSKIRLDAVEGKKYHCMLVIILGCENSASCMYIINNKRY